jgi:imidazole glycerol-phosphate synthase subunit HisH
VITIIDYGLGNIAAFLNLYKRANIQVTVAKSAADLASASRLILPGVGAFDHAMHLLDQSGMRPTLEELVVEKGMPVLGICVGMQILAGSSEEGTREGLRWVPGRVKAFKSLGLGDRLPLPHMGWNDVKATGSGGLLEGLESDARFYFLHSYYFECDVSENVLAVSDYGLAFSCAVGRKNVYGVQFHPEKSHHFGTRLLQNFAEL